MTFQANFRMNFNVFVPPGISSQTIQIQIHTFSVGIIIPKNHTTFKKYLKKNKNVFHF